MRILAIVIVHVCIIHERPVAHIRRLLVIDFVGRECKNNLFAVRIIMGRIYRLVLVGYHISSEFTVKDILCKEFAFAEAPFPRKNFRIEKNSHLYHPVHCLAATVHGTVYRKRINSFIKFTEHPSANLAAPFFESCSIHRRYRKNGSVSAGSQRNGPAENLEYIVIAENTESPHFGDIRVIFFLSYAQASRPYRLHVRKEVVAKSDSRPCTVPYFVYIV